MYYFFRNKLCSLLNEIISNLNKISIPILEKEKMLRQLKSGIIFIKLIRFIFNFNSLKIFQSN